MKEIIIEKNQAGQRFDKFLFKYFKEAPSSFIYKMLRKKNIVLNGKKSDGTIRVYFRPTDENLTGSKFTCSI